MVSYKICLKRTPKLYFKVTISDINDNSRNVKSWYYDQNFFGSTYTTQLNFSQKVSFTDFLFLLEWINKYNR